MESAATPNAGAPKSRAGVWRVVLKVVVRTLLMGFLLQKISIDEVRVRVERALTSRLPRGELLRETA